MKAVVLAGGKGTRLRPITLNKPKPLVPVHNKPILDYIIEKLPKEVDEILLACNFEKKQIEKYYRDKEMQVTVVDEPEPLGTGGAVKNMEQFIDDDFLVFNGDILSSLDIKKFIEFHKEKGGVGSLSLWRVEDPTRYGIIGTNEDGSVTGFKEKPSKEEVFSHWINAGMYAYSPKIFDYIEENKKVSMEHEVFPKIIDELFGYKFNGYWIDIGTPSSYLEAHKLLKQKEDPRKRISESAVLKGEVRGHSSLGEHVVVEEDAVVRDSVILGDSEIKRGAEIKNSLIGSNTVIEEDAVINGCSIGDNACVKNDTELWDGLRVWNDVEVNDEFLSEVC